MRWRPRVLGLGAIVVGAVALSTGGGAVWGAFSAPTRNTGNEVRSAPDFVAPFTSGATLQKSTGGTPGFVRSGAGYRILAAVTDSGRPSSGIVAVSTAANGGAAGTPLTAATFPAVGGITYTHRSALQTFGTLPAGSYSFSIGASDGAGNGRTQAGFPYVVDNTAPTTVDVSTTNRTGGIAGRAEAGDTMTLVHSEPLDPISVEPGWDGSAATNVIAYLVNGVNGAFDSLTFYDADTSAVLPLGTIDLGRTDYTLSSRTFGQTGTPSRLVASGNALVVTLGTASGTTTTATGVGALRWAVAAGPTDRAGNALRATTFAVGGTAGREF
jgi:hypothetical protein